MYTVAIDISGGYALFRKPYAPLSPVSFPLPPPTALMGMVGAICGYGKGEYHERISWQTFRVGVRLLSPIRTMRTAINLLNTGGSELDALWRPQKDSHRDRIPHEFLVDPAWRVWLTGMTEQTASLLVSRLRGAGPVYTPALGLASCLADVALVDHGEATALGRGPIEALHCVVPMENGTIAYDPTRPYARLRVPGTMDPQRQVHRYPEVAVATDAGPVLAAGVARYQLGEDVFALL